MFKTPLKLILAGAVAMPVFLAPDVAFAGGKQNRGHHNNGHHSGGHHNKGNHSGGHHFNKHYGYGYGSGHHYRKRYYAPNYYYGGGYYYGGHHSNAAAYAGLAILGVAALGYVIHESKKNKNYYNQGGYAQPNAGYVQSSPPRVIVVPQEGSYQQENVAPESGFDFSQCRETREYQTTILVAGQEQLAYGTACLMPDGTWVAGPMQIGR